MLSDGALGVYVPAPRVEWRNPILTDNLIGEDIVRVTRNDRGGYDYEYGLIAVTDVYQRLQPMSCGGPVLVVNVVDRRDYYAALVLGTPQPYGDPVAIGDLWVREDTPTR